MLTEHQKTLIVNSWNDVKPISAQAAEIFYNKLFELDPTLRPLFKNDLKSQQIKLVGALNHVVNSLNDLPNLVPVLQQLGKRHVGYGVQPSHFTTVGDALLRTFAIGLGDKFTDEVRDAWTVAYTLIANVMIDAMNAPQTGSLISE